MLKNFQVNIGKISFGTKTSKTRLHLKQIRKFNLFGKHLKIEDFTMMPSKECKTLVYNMLNDDLLFITVNFILFGILKVCKY